MSLDVIFIISHDDDVAVNTRHVIITILTAVVRPTQDITRLGSSTYPPSMLTSAAECPVPLLHRNWSSIHIKQGRTSTATTTDLPGAGACTAPRTQTKIHAVVSVQDTFGWFPSSMEQVHVGVPAVCIPHLCAGSGSSSSAAWLLSARKMMHSST